jgi:RimJ/RimL family protein N-acetyltransferase
MTTHVSFIMPPMFEDLAVPLAGRLVTLEPVGPQHEDGLRKAAADERTWQWMWTRDVDVWIADVLRPQPDRRPFAMLQEGEVVGSTSYLALAPEHRRLEIGNTWLNPSAWGTGANTEAKYLLLRHAFEAGALRVEFKTDALNERARAALAALPSEFEGIHRWHMVVRGGERRDSAWYAVTVETWPETRRALEARLGRA